MRPRRCAKALAAALLGAVGTLGASESMVPQIQHHRDWWLPRFVEKRGLATTNDYPVIFLGDSITHHWEDAGREVWEANFAAGERRALNCGFSADRTEHVLWRLDHGQFGRSSPKAVVLMIGTNNAGQRPAHEETPIDTIAAVRAIVLRLRAAHPDAKIVLHPIFPRGATAQDALRIRNDLVNEQLPHLADGEQVVWCDFNARLVGSDGSLSPKMMPDRLHPGRRGYEIWAETVRPYLDWALGKGPLPAGEMAKAVTALEPPTNAAPANAACAFRWFEDGRFQRKREEIARNRSRWFDLVMVGDAAARSWETEGASALRRALPGSRILNLGFDGDRVQNAIWSCGVGGLLDGYRAGLVTVQIGAQNRGDRAEDVAAGIGRLVAVIRSRQPFARVLLLPISPDGRGSGAARRLEIERVNALARKLCDGERVAWLDLATGKADEDDPGAPRDGRVRTTDGHAAQAEALRLQLMALPLNEVDSRR